MTHLLKYSLMTIALVIFLFFNSCKKEPLQEGSIEPLQEELEETADLDELQEGSIEPLQEEITDISCRIEPALGYHSVKLFGRIDSKDTMICINVINSGTYQGRISYREYCDGDICTHTVGGNSTLLSVISTDTTLIVSEPSNNYNFTFHFHDASIYLAKGNNKASDIAIFCNNNYVPYTSAFLRYVEKRATIRQSSNTSNCYYGYNCSLDGLNFLMP